MKEYIQKDGFNIVYDALGGGPVTGTIINNLPPKGVYHVYGGLEGKPLEITQITALTQGAIVTGFSMFPWWMTSSKETQEKIRSSYSELLKN